MQQRRASASGRPSGTDGSDFSYRMVVDSRYTKVAKGKSRLSKLIFAQVFIQLIGLLLTFLLSSKVEGPNPLSLSSDSLGLISLIIGELGRKRSRVILLRVCMVASSIAVLLSVSGVIKTNSILELFSFLQPPSAALQAVFDNFAVNNPSNWEGKKFELLETARVLLGSLIQIFLVSTTISLIGNMSPPKKAS